MVMEVETSVSALPLAELGSAAFYREAERQPTFSDQAVDTPARDPDLDPLALARVQASEAAALPYRVYRDSPCRDPEAFPAHSLPLSGAASKSLAPMVLAATTVFTVDFPITASATMVLVWAAATD